MPAWIGTVDEECADALGFGGGEDLACEPFLGGERFYRQGLGWGEGEAEFAESVAFSRGVEVAERRVALGAG